MIREQIRKTWPGIPFGIAFVVIHILAVGAVAAGVLADVNVALIVGGVLATAVTALFWVGMFMVAPNEAKVLQFFGDYVGTVRKPGLHWANPFFTKQKVSTRIRNFDSDRLKVNDFRGNPIEIAAVVVWQVVDTAEAVFEVDDFEDFVNIQSESALRGLTARYPYDVGDEEAGVALRSHADEVSGRLAEDIQDRLDKAGVKVIEARISHLAYASEIAGAMLRRQQAAAIIDARRRIVDGAVGMVEMALAKLSEHNVVELDDERRAAMISNLLVVLCSEHGTTPVVNTGTLYG